MISGDCKWKAEVARLLEASVLLRANLKAGHLSTSDAWYALNHTINKTAEYPLMATYLTKDDCKTIMKPFLNAGLSVFGVVHTMPHAVVWGPLRYQGLGIRHLWTTQGVEHTLDILCHAMHPTLTGQLLRTTMEEMQLEIGVSNSFLACSYEDYGCLATRSSGATWQFLSKSKLTMKDTFAKPQLAYEDNCFLMERLFAHRYRGSKLKHLNSCRMHLHALLLSDLCTAYGRQLTDLATEVQPDPHRSSTFTFGPALIAPISSSVHCGVLLWTKFLSALQKP
jgi:hypothetical protein